MRIALSILLLTLSAQADTFYVSTLGNDTTGNGSEANPYRTIQIGVDIAAGGDTVSVGAGDYAEYVVTKENNVTIRGNGASTAAFRINQHTGITIDGFTITGAQMIGNTWASAHVRIENAAHGATITNCTIGPGVFSPAAANWGMVFDHTSQTVSNAAISDWAALGFRVGGKVYNGVSSKADHFFANSGKAWTIRGITNSVMGLDGDWVTETNAYTWSPVHAGNGYNGIYGVFLVTGSSKSATNVSILGNTFTNLFGNAIDTGLGHTVTVANNAFRGLNGYKWINPGGTNILVVSNTVYSSPNFVFYSQAELDNPEVGASFYDYEAGFIHSALTITRDVTFAWNWIENVHNPIAQLDDVAGSTNLNFHNNVFVGVGKPMSGGCNGFTIASNTFYRVGVRDGQATALGLGAGGITNVVLMRNAFIDIGDHARTNISFYSVSGSAGVTINSNFAAHAETWGYRGTGGFPDANGINGGDPLLLDIANPRGADGLPFTADDGLRPLPNSPLVTLAAGALARVAISAPVAHFRVTSPATWQEPTGTNYNAAWWTNEFYLRTNIYRPYDTPETLGKVPCIAAFNASGSVSGNWSTNSNYGIRFYDWDFGDGGTVTTVRQEVEHTYLRSGTFPVRLTVRNTYGIAASVTNTYAVLPNDGTFTNKIYFVATNGTDTAAGTNYAAPFLTLQKALSVVAAGDYVAVQPGYYATFLDINRNVATSTNRIRWVGYGARLSGVKIRNPYYTWDGFTMDASVSDVASGTMYVYAAAHGTHLLRNRVQNTPDGEAGVYVAASGTTPLDGNLNGVVSDNVFTNIGYITCFIGNGSNWTVRGNATINSWSEGDFVRPFGANHWIADNYCTNLNSHSVNGDTSGGHPDFFQFYGDGGQWCKDIIVERNTIEGNPDSTTDAAICQISSQNFASANHTNLVFRNNVFRNVRGSGSLSLDGIKWYNNLFYRTPRDTTAVTTGGGSRGSCWGTVYTNNIFFGSGLTDDATAGGWYYNDASGDEATNTTVFADFNYVAGTNFTSKQVAPPNAADRWGSFGQEANSVNGGDPGWVDAENGNFQLRPDSILAWSGTALTEFNDTIDGQERPALWSIGPFCPVDSVYVSPPEPEPATGGGRWRIKHARGFLR